MCQTQNTSALIGWLGTAYFGGFTIGCFLGPKIIMSVGHARTFAGITALLTATILAFPLFVDLLFWGVLRVLSGACLAMLYIVVESWLYRLYSKTRKFSWVMTRKLSDTLSRNFFHSCGMVSRMNARMASANFF